MTAVRVDSEETGLEAATSLGSIPVGCLSVQVNSMSGRKEHGWEQRVRTCGLWRYEHGAGGTQRQATVA